MVRQHHFLTGYGTRFGRFRVLIAGLCELWSHLETDWCFVRVSEAMGYLSSGPYETGVEEERHRTCLSES